MPLNDRIPLAQCILASFLCACEHLIREEFDTLSPHLFDGCDRSFETESSSPVGVLKAVEGNSSFNRCHVFALSFIGAESVVF